VTRGTWKQRWNEKGGGAELMKLALPLILSNSVWTLQVTLDRIMLSRSSSDAVAAAMPAVCVFWTPFILLQYTANYATTFVSQYLGAGRPERIGAAVWQSIYFSLFAGLLFAACSPWLSRLLELTDHTPAVKALEITYFRVLAFSALPMLIVASVNSFFAGRGATWTVLVIDASGLVVNAILAYVLIFGKLGLPEMGIAGAGWATVAGSSASATVGLALFLHRSFREEFGTLAGRHFDPALFWRLLRFGLPSGLQLGVDVLAFTFFIVLVGDLGPAELGATSITFSINMVAVLPMLGVAQAVSVLVGQRLGGNRADLAERSTKTGFKIAWLYMTGMAALYVLVPGAFLWLFQSEAEPDKWEAVAARVPKLLRFVAIYSLFDSINLVFCFALRGAGDTRFVTFIAMCLAWPIMVLPTWAALEFGWGLYWCWTFASAYIVSLACTFWIRFRMGKWKTMRVIESNLLPKADAAPGLNGIVSADRREEQIVVADVRNSHYQDPHAPLSAVNDAGRNVDQ
jgi:MATE family multidrug resistance protein